MKPADIVEMMKEHDPFGAMAEFVKDNPGLNSEQLAIKMIKDGNLFVEGKGYTGWTQVLSKNIEKGIEDEVLYELQGHYEDTTKIVERPAKLIFEAIKGSLGAYTLGTTDSLHEANRQTKKHSKQNGGEYENGRFEEGTFEEKNENLSGMVFRNRNDIIDEIKSKDNRERD